MENTYKSFVDSAWFGEVKPDWVPYLIDNNLLTQAQKDTIENKISVWKDDIYGSKGTTWVYIIIGFLIIVIVILILIKRKPKPPAVVETNP